MSSKADDKVSRRTSRERALKLLYQWELSGRDVEELLGAPQEEAEGSFPIDPFCRALVEGTLRHRELLDAEISQWASHWSLERMSLIDRNILRLAAYELIFQEDIPPKVTINEAIEIAKKYSTADSAAFVNGILDQIHRAHALEGAEENSPCD